MGFEEEISSSIFSLPFTRAFQKSPPSSFTIYQLPVDLVDERLTSSAAQADLRDARRSGARRRRVRREDIDANAARLILETWLQDPIRPSGSTP